MKRFPLTKRILFALFCLLPLTLAACGGTPALDSSFSGELQATDGIANYTASLEADGDFAALTFNAPESVAGLCCTFTDGELHTSLRGLDCITPADSLPAASVPHLVHAVFSEAENAVFQSSEAGEDLFSVGTATVMARDGVPQRITSGSLTIVLKQP